MKNEVNAIAEWLAFQKVIGFDNVMVYDNGSADGTSELVEQIRILEPTISLTAWPDRTGQAPQPSAYAHAAKHCTTEWLAFFDVDEFLVLHRHPNVNSFLSAVPDDRSAVAVNWRIFGSAGQIKAERGLVIERFTRCAPSAHPKNRFCKTIARRNAIKKIGVHTVELQFGGYVNSLLRPIDLDSDAKTATICLQGAQLNHYLVKSWQEFTEKRARGNAARAPEAHDKYSHRGNAVAPPRFKWNVSRSNEFWVTHDLNWSRDLTVMNHRRALISVLRSWNIQIMEKSGNISGGKVSIWLAIIRDLLAKHLAR